MSNLSGFKFNDGDGNFFDLDDIFVKNDAFFSGALWNWGCNAQGQLADLSLTSKSSPVQTSCKSLGWRQVSNGSDHTVAIKTDGTLWRWGKNDFGQLGDSTLSFKCSPVNMGGLTALRGLDCFKQASAGGCFTSTINVDGQLWSWGRNNCGQLGDGSTIDKSTPIQNISATLNWKVVSAGQSHVAALKTDGTLWLWGDNSSGQLGNDSTVTGFSSPVQTISGGTNWKQASSGIGHTAAIKTDGSLWLWGCNSNGELGLNSTNLICRSPVQTVSGGTNWKQVSAGGINTGAVKTDGTLWVWGNNLCGQLGDNSTISKSSPVQTIAGGFNWKQVNFSSDFAVAIKTDGSLWTWGSNQCGVLGTNTTTNRSSPAQTISGGNYWVQVSSPPGSNGKHVSAIKNYWE